MISNKGPLKIKSSHKLIIKRVSILFFFYLSKRKFKLSIEKKKIIIKIWALSFEVPF